MSLKSERNTEEMKAFVKYFMKNKKEKEKFENKETENINLKLVKRNLRKFKKKQTKIPNFWTMWQGRHYLALTEAISVLYTTMS